MYSQKLDNLLNLALNSTQEEIENSPNLITGYDKTDGRWEVIVKYVGDISFLREQNIEVVELLNGYAILNLLQEQIDDLIKLTNIIFVEKPKRLYFAIENVRREICVNQLQSGISLNNMQGLFGEGVLVAVIDSGIDYTNPDFIEYERDSQTGKIIKKSRIISIWDQTIQGTPPMGYASGTQYDNAMINQALNLEADTVLSRDNSGHGTVVASIAAGNGNASNARYIGIAPKADIIAVKLGVPRADSFPKTSELMQGIDYVIRKAIELKKPVAINLSFGNTYGSHDGNSLLETYINEASDVWQSVICVGTGNEGAASGHTSGKLLQNEIRKAELSVGEYETGFGLQIWKNYADNIRISLTSPGGEQIGPLEERLGTQRYNIEETQLLVYYGEPFPYSAAQEIYIDFLPLKDYIKNGIWSINLSGLNIISGEYDMWLPSQAALSQNTRFVESTTDTTLTIPSTASKVISVGAVNALNMSYADFSGRGYTRLNGIKPDISAPGVDINVAVSPGIYASYSGTSMATPFVTGAAALMMEWGIIRGNDFYLYGEKLKAYLIRGAKKLPGLEVYPNPQVGWGILCIMDSIPE